MNMFSCLDSDNDEPVAATSKPVVKKGKEVAKKDTTTAPPAKAAAPAAKDSAPSKPAAGGNKKPPAAKNGALVRVENIRRKHMNDRFTNGNQLFFNYV